MLSWLVVECLESIDCIDAPFVLRVVLSDTQPPHSLNGPFEDAGEALDRMRDYLWWDEQGGTHLRNFE